MIKYTYLKLNNNHSNKYISVAITSHIALYRIKYLFSLHFLISFLFLVYDDIS